VIDLVLTALLEHHGRKNIPMENRNYFEVVLIPTSSTDF